MKEKILMLHGALGNASQFTNIKELIKDKFDVYQLDFEGHGEIDSNSEFSIDIFTKQVIQFLEDENIDHINLFGYSMGGYVGLNAALAIPNKIGKIITLGTKFNWDLESTAREITMLDPKLIEEKVPKFALKLNEQYFPQDWKQVVIKTAKMMKILSKSPNLTDKKLKSLNQNVVIGIGSLDEMVSYEESSRIADLLQNGKLKLLEGMKHPIDKIDPKAVETFIKELLS